jgi:hypothetical protein
MGAAAVIGGAGGAGGSVPSGVCGRSVMRTVSFLRGTADVLIVGRGGVGF